MVPGLIAVQSIVIDRLCDLLFALLALLPTLALVAGFTSAPMATLLTGLAASPSWGSDLSRCDRS